MVLESHKSHYKPRQVPKSYNLSLDSLGHQGVVGYIWSFSIKEGFSSSPIVVELDENRTRG